MVNQNYRASMMTRKINALVGSEERRFEYGSTFSTETAGGQSRLTIGFDHIQDFCVRELATGLAGPFQLLYVLHTTRIGSELGRYESPVLAASEVQGFMDQFGPFLSQDARHDVWLRSHDDNATIVLDRHNLIYAYGPLAAFCLAVVVLAIRLARRSAVWPLAFAVVGTFLAGELAFSSSRFDSGWRDPRLEAAVLFEGCLVLVAGYAVLRGLKTARGAAAGGAI